MTSNFNTKSEAPRDPNKEPPRLCQLWEKIQKLVNADGEEEEGAEQGAKK